MFSVEVRRVAWETEFRSINTGISGKHPWFLWEKVFEFVFHELTFNEHIPSGRYSVGDQSSSGNKVPDLTEHRVYTGRMSSPPLLIITPPNHQPQLSLAKTWLISQPSTSSLPILVTFMLVYGQNTQSEETIQRGPTLAETLLSQYTEQGSAVLAVLLLMDQSLVNEASLA